MSTPSSPKATPPANDGKKKDLSKNLLILVVIPLLVPIVGNFIKPELFSSDKEAAEMLVPATERDVLPLSEDNLVNAADGIEKMQIQEADLRFLDSLIREYQGIDSLDRVLFEEEFKLHRFSYTTEAGQITELEELREYSAHFRDTLGRRFVELN